MRILILLFITLLSGAACRVEQEIELISEGPVKGRRVKVYLEHRDLFSKPKLAIEVGRDGAYNRLGPGEIASAGAPESLNETFDAGICLAEVSWVSDQVAAILVKNCLGRITLLAFDCETLQVNSGLPYLPSIRASILKRYRKELQGGHKDPLEWVKTKQATDAYRWRRLGNGRLMD